MAERGTTTGERATRGAGGAGRGEPGPGSADPAALAAVVLDEEARRHAAGDGPPREYADDELMVVGDDVTLADAFRQGGVSLLVAVMAVAVVQSLDTAALAVMAPDIQASLGVSSAVLGAIGGAAGVLFVMGAIPIAALADHRRRTTIAGACTLAYGLLSVATAAVGNAFWLFAARMGSGLAASHILPVHSSLLADAYPMKARGRIFSIYGLGTPIGQLLGPVTVGAVAALAGGIEGWRWAFVAVGVPAMALAAFVATRREPPRGMNEQVAVLGEVIEAERDPVAISTSIAFARLRQIATFRSMLIGIGALGFGLFSVPIFLNIFMEETFGLSAFERGTVGSIVVVPSLLVLPFVGRLNDRLFRQSPPRSLVLCAGLISLFGVFVTVALSMPNEASFVAALAVATLCANAGFMMVGPIVAAVVPYRVRTQGYAMVGVYIFLSGAFLGAVLAGVMSDAWGIRIALSVLCIPSALIGGALLATGAVHIRGDIGRVMEELEEERAEAARVRDHEGGDQVLQVRNLDFSYGAVQVLFGVDLDVRRGEVLALLGTNGAGKSTLLRCICGLGVPSRGTVRLHGRTLTFTEPEERVRLGIAMMPGGSALWDPLSVEENLRLGAFVLRNDSRERDRRMDRVMTLFPELHDLLDQPAGTLSGGQKQVVALAKAMLLEPEVLLIDELSLGLSPIAAQNVLEKVERLRDEGLTIVIVEQSVNVALSIADRAVFMEKGQVRFDGPAAELLERGDLLRAVFLGGDAHRGIGGRRVTLLGVVTVFGVDLNPQDLFDGAVTGLVYGFLAIGVILLYRVSGIVNFAYGAVGSLAAVLVAKMCIDWGWPYVPALVVGVASAAAVSCAIEVTVVRRLFDSARITLFVATIGVAQLVTVLVINVPRVEGFGAAFPTPFDGTWQLGGDITLHAPQVVALAVIPMVALALGWFMNRTIWGIAITGTAANPDASRLAGLSPRRVSTLVWVLAGALAGLTTVLAAPLRSTPVTGLAQGSGIQVLVIALAVALLARMRSMMLAVAAGVVVGMVERVVFYNWANQSGLMEVVLFGVVLGGVLLAHRGAAGGVAGAWSLSGRVAPLPDRLRAHVLVRRLPWGVAVVALVIAVVVPLAIDTNAKYFLYSRMALIAIVVVSVTILTGWAGQLSLAQFALAGLGAMTMAGADIHLDLQLLPALGVSVAVCVAAAVVMGIPSFRVQGMYLAIVTLAFANAAYAWLFHQRIFNAGRDASRYEPDHLRIGSLDLSDRRTFYLVCLAALVVVVLLANRLRRSGVGRALLAVRDNESSAAAFTIAPRTTKLAAFAVAGGLSGFAGALLMALLTNARADQFPVDMSLSAVSMAVIGGLASAAGAVVGTLWVVGLPAAFGANETVGLLTSGVGLLVLIMYFPGGLVQVAYAVRGVIVRAVERRMPPGPARPTDAVPLAASPRPARPAELDDADADAGVPDLVVRGLTVRFGERTVVDGVDLRLDRNEVVGLIGANGAGKTTIMDAVGGFLPSEGRVELLGDDIGSLSASRRAERGLGRSFQDARLFSDLTVLETVALAHERVLPTRMLSVLAGVPTWRRRDRAQLARARDLVDHLGLGAYADHFVGTLSTGTRRICELACILALEPRVICLDEPTAGVAQRETEAFGPLIGRIRADLGASMLVIEHDMPFVMAISDRVYCLETGTIIAEGPPARVRDDPRVIASYLGTDERAIQRSGAAAPAVGPPLVLARDRAEPTSASTPGSL